jgi:hypothetical protein
MKCEVVGEFKKLYTREKKEEIITKKTENSFIEIKSLSDYTKNRYKSIDSKGNNILISKKDYIENTILKTDDDSVENLF